MYLGRREMHKQFWWGNLIERDRLRDPNVNGSLILILILKEYDGTA
jgi:hypothetical protein